MLNYGKEIEDIVSTLDIETQKDSKKVAEYKKKIKDTVNELKNTTNTRKESLLLTNLLDFLSMYCIYIGDIKSASIKAENSISDLEDYFEDNEDDY